MIGLIKESGRNNEFVGNNSSFIDMDKRLSTVGD
jgi:hypothetical protein